MASDIDDLDFIDISENQSHIDWSVYSEHYDELCNANPAYHELVSDLSRKIETWGLPDGVEVCDFGGGTGSFVLAAAEKIPKGKFHHVDFDEGMLAKARAKYAESGIDVAIHNNDIRHFPAEKYSFDIAICINTIYSIPEHDQVLSLIRQCTKPGGFLYIVDFGRKVELIDWAIYILRNRVKELGLRETIRWYRDNAENLSQNRRGAKAQAEGTYWLHTPEEFEQSLSNAGWDVVELSKCYRDCCDRAICVNPP